MPWRRDFPDHDVPRRIQDLVDQRLLEDASAPEDPAPSFVAKLVKRGWLRIWVEHPELARRLAGPYRYRVEITNDLKDYGRLLIEDNSLEEIWPTFFSNLKILGARSRFRLMGAGGRKRAVWNYDFGSVHTTVTDQGSAGGWFYYQVAIESSRAGPMYVRSVQATNNPQEAAMSILRSLYYAWLDPAKTIAKTVEFGGTREQALSIVRAAEELGGDDLAPAFKMATERYLGMVEEPPPRGPHEWWPKSRT